MKNRFKAALAALFVALTVAQSPAANRLNFYSGIVPPSQWYNLQQRYERLGEGAFKTAIFGTGGSYQNLSVTPQTGLYVQVGPTNTSAVGSLYQFQADDAAAYPPSGPINNSYQLPPDPTLVTVQGTTIANGNPIGPLPVPGSNSQISLIECDVVTNDTGAVSTNFISQLGTLQSDTVNRDRADQIICQSKPGTPSASPTVPPVDSGYIAVGYVTIPSGTSTITSGMITASPSLGHAVMDGAASTQTIAGLKAFAQPVTAPSFVGDVPNGIFNVKTYGATGDGTTDDTVAIQAAVNAAIAAKGGTVYFPAGKYKITSTITIPSTGSVGIIVRGSGTGAYTASGGSTIQVAFASGDIFYMPGTSGGNLGDPAFFDLNVDASGITRTSGATFDYKIPSGGHISHVYTNRDYDAVAWGTPGVDTQNMIDIHDSEFFQVRHYVFHATGDTNGGGTYIHDILAYGNGTEEAAGTNYAYVQDSGAIVDPIYMTNIDFEGLANGYYANISSGYINDAFYSNIIFDGIPSGAAMEFRTTGTGFIENVHLSNIWATTNSAADSIILDAENLQSTSAGVHLFTIDGITAASSGGNCMSFSNGVTDVTVTNSQLYSCPSGNGIAIAGSSTKSDKNIVVSGSHFGGIFGSDSFGIAAVYASGLTLTGNDFTGVSTDALAFGGTNTGFSATGNNMTGVGVISGTIPTDSMFRGNKGYNTETSDATSTTTRFTYNALTACTSTNLLADTQNAGTSEFNIDCSGNTTQLGTANVAGVVSSGIVKVPDGNALITSAAGTATNVFGLGTLGTTSNVSMRAAINSTGSGYMALLSAGNSSTVSGITGNVFAFKHATGGTFTSPTGTVNDAALDISGDLGIAGGFSAGGGNVLTYPWRPATAPTCTVSAAGTTCNTTVSPPQSTMICSANVQSTGPLFSGEARQVSVGAPGATVQITWQSTAAWTTGGTVTFNVTCL